MDKYNMLNEYDEVLLPRDVQKILHLGRNTVYKYLADGTIKAVRIGSTYRIPKQNLLDFLYPIEQSGKEEARP